jgi:hypothetical protein
MITLWIITGVLVVSVMLLVLVSINDGWDDPVLGILLGSTAFVTFGFLIALAVCGFGWEASKHKVKIINQEYGTSYTAEEVFWASDVIYTIRVLDRKRSEVNGDLMRKEK